MKCTLLASLAGAVFLLAPAAQAAVIHFNELPEQVLNGLTVNGVTFHFSIGGNPSSDARFGTNTGPGNVVEIHPPNVEGNANGLLTIGFAAPVNHVEFGLALSEPGAFTPGAVITLFDPALVSLGTSNLNTAPPGPGQFSQGHFSYTGAPLGQLQVDFSSTSRFALDDLAFDLAPAGPINPLPLPAAVWPGFAIAAGLLARRTLIQK